MFHIALCYSEWCQGLYISSPCQHKETILRSNLHNRIARWVSSETEEGLSPLVKAAIKDLRSDLTDLSLTVQKLIPRLQKGGLFFSMFPDQIKEQLKKEGVPERHLDIALTRALKKLV